MIVHLIDGTYELFRHFYGLRRFTKDKDRPYGAVAGVLQTVLQMIEQGATHVGVATDHVIESFRNRLWDGYKTGEGIEPALLRQFHPLEDALVAMGVVTWPMVDLEADDAARVGGAVPPTIRASRRSASGRRTRISPMCRRRSRRADGPCRQDDPRRQWCSEEVRRRSALIPDYWHSSATLPTVIPAFRASARSPPRSC